MNDSRVNSDLSFKIKQKGTQAAQFKTKNNAENT